MSRRHPPAAGEVTRFAPSPTGLLHLGHAFSALDAARAAGAGGRFLLRIEDIDTARCKPAFEQAIFDDLALLGLSWETPVMRQAGRMDAYAAALDRLAALEVVYPCFCSRKDIRAEAERLGGAPHGPLGTPYPGTCRDLPAAERQARIDAGTPHALRLDHARAHERVGRPEWTDRRHGTFQADLSEIGDVMLARKEVATSYHLAVVVDDAAQGITLVTRGEDLLPATPIHRVLQALLELPVPDWRHHALIADDDGRRLAKRDDAVALRAYREQGHSPAAVRALAGVPD
ncbi:tRNA glutamyl-Q(34) synthetase GluQRS [Rhodovibrio sodomensis]|uniref:tRNA glutamyl-Q(34) synthetase GluQRS n=1 Tax=Rhodovibrio sodomensis TaxID=1088 RepID=A0ABS1DKE1_9PROT|nr:tRNA glutamyl-Q(34) synthetase GluQRS [Rhodovibrio sodomensis]MBK1670981.1 tRNA glutamyl-Q(34) synthetase GluQRS [Rhodovibrio sodomensis]